MSGIAGIVQLDSAPVDRALIQKMADALAFRGPDGRHVWTSASVGFAHTLLKTTFEAESEQQPASLDGQVWITADARIDSRQDLAGELGLPQSALSRPDCELILHSYARWGEACVEHLLGDFAFAIWDNRARKLFCARDHFGVKPFYYAHLADTFIFSNTLNCIRMHPAVSSELNELAIADFLIFDYNQDPATTTFSDIQRLPAAHILIATAKGVTTRRYWSLPEGESIRYKRTRDYVEHFRSLLESATADRLRTNKVSIMMSGGLDSSSVAAFARKVRPQAELHAHTLVYDWLIPHDERHYAGLVAKALDIPIEYHPFDKVRPFEKARYLATPEPFHNPLFAALTVYYNRMESESPVALSGCGADALFSLSPLWNWGAVRAIPVVDTTVNFFRYIWQMRTVPKFRIRSTILNLLGRSSQDQAGIPAWLEEAFSRRCNVRNRNVEFGNSVRKSDIRPSARCALRSVYWPSQFESEDATAFGGALEWRRPYFDIRLVRYLLAIPELPYCMDKYILRLALKGILPEAIRSRPKTPLRGDPLLAAFNRYGLRSESKPHQRLSDFVNPSAISLPTQHNSTMQLWIALKPISLNYWLTSQEEL